MRTFEYRLYPTRQQATQLMNCLRESRLLYNEMLEATKAEYGRTGKFLFRNELCGTFRGRGREHIPASTVQMLADRLDKALRRYLDHKKHNPHAGFPRFKGANRWRSIDLRQHQADFRLSDDQRYLIVPGKIGRQIKIKLHRPLEGTPKIAHLVLRADRHWYALIVCETPAQADAVAIHGETPTCEHGDIGLDLGLKVFVADSEGQTVENPRYLRKQLKTLRRKQRTLSRRKRGSHRRSKAARSVARTHLTISRQRRDFLFKTASHYAGRYRRIMVEDLHVQALTHNHSLAQSILDAGWSMFLAILADKAERAGHAMIRVPARFTTQDCSQCGERVAKSLRVRTHRCPACGYVADRDLNAALNILRAGAQPSGTAPTREPDEPSSRCH